MLGFRKSASGAVLGLLWLAACGGGLPSSAPDQASPNLTLTLSSAGVTPKQSSVSSNGSVEVINGDSIAHQLASNPDPQQTECPELNGPVLQPGDQFTTIIDNRNGTCAFIDGLNPTDGNFQGTITVMPPDPNTGGYVNGG